MSSTWKVMLAFATGLIFVASYAALFDDSLGPLTILVLAAFFGGVFFVTMRFGWSLGNQMRPKE